MPVKKSTKTKATTARKNAEAQKALKKQERTTKTKNAPVSSSNKKGAPKGKSIVAQAKKKTK